MKGRHVLFISILSSALFSTIGLIAYHYLIMPDYGKLPEIEKNRIIRTARQALLWDDTLSGRFYSPHPDNFITAAEAGRKSVVFIRPLAKNPSPNSSQSLLSGSGVLVSSDGFIVTNQHVLGEAELVEVVLQDRRVFKANLVGEDMHTDLALLKIESENLPFLVMGNSDSLSVGEWVLAVGNPFNLQSTVTAGIVSAKARNINMLESQGIESFIQTDAAVNPGSSGGALINTAGLLVGINTAIMSEKGNYEGFSFAVPVNVVRKVIADLKEFGVVQRGWLGVEIEEVDNAMAKDAGMNKIQGVFVSAVLKDGSAQIAGIRKNDIIIRVNQTEISNTASFMEVLARFRPGETIQVTIQRNQLEMELNCTLKNHLNTYDPVAIYKNGIFESLGFEVRNLDFTEKSLFGKTGVLVVSIKRGTTIHNTKMEPGFIIREVNGIKIKNGQHLKEILESNKGKEVRAEGIYKNFVGSYPYVFTVPE